MSNYNGTEIAVIGMAGQFPGADNIQEFWSNLKEGKESIAFFSKEELQREGYDESLLNDPAFVNANAFLKNKEYFDSEFFGYTPAEAAIMDPQLRLFHENCWKALEDAGYYAGDKNEKVGLFAGGSSNNNWQNFAIISGNENKVDEFTATQLRDVSFLCTRVSYLLNLQGPSVFLNTACSTSLVAIQRASMSLLLHECNLALAGGITINNFTTRGYVYQEGMINSADGHCRTFDADASGTVGSEGVGVVVLKRLTDALKDNDNIYAIIKGSAVNNDGNNKISYTAPGVDGQYRAIVKAINMAKIVPRSISYVEAHGTATKLGDPIEVEALTRVFGESNEKYCALGSVKTNIGHLDSAAGVAGFIKTVLALKHRMLPPSLHFKKQNPKINFEASPFYVQTTLTEWKNDHHPLRAGVSSFGIGGTNAHVILEEAPVRDASLADEQCQVLPVSAKSEDALVRNIENLRTYLEQHPHENLADIAYTLQTGRAHFDYRITVTGNSVEAVLRSLSVVHNKDKIKRVPEKDKPLLVFMFPGQGSQSPGMFKNLYESTPAFRNVVDECLDIIKRVSSKDLHDTFFSVSSNDITNTEFAQPALFVVEYALAQMLMQLGVAPTVMIGHSIGEYVAACLSGVFSLEDSLVLIMKRGQLMQRVASGAMLSVSISEAQLKPILKTYKDISLAAVNSSELCVVSGKDKSIAAIASVLESDGHPTRVLHTSHAFHSYMMDEILDDFAQEVARIKINPPRVPFISNLSGKAITAAEVIKPSYWVNHLRQPVRFSDGIEALLANKDVIFLEVGPGKALSSMVRSNKLKTENHRVINVMRHPEEVIEDTAHVRAALGKLWSAGVSVKWEALHSQRRRRISLPTYAFEKTKYKVNVDAYKMVSDMLSEAGASTRKNIVSEWFHATTWVAAEAEPSRTNTKGRTETLLFIDRTDVGNRIREALAFAGEKIFCAFPGKEFKSLSQNEVEVNPNSLEDVISLLQTASGKINCRIVFAWGACSNSSTVEMDKNRVTENYYRLLNVVRAAGNALSQPVIEFVLITFNGQQVLKSDSVSPHNAIASGALRVIMKEYNNIQCRNIDISLSDTVAPDLTFLSDEVIQGDKNIYIAYRAGTRFIQTTRAIQAPAPEKDALPWKKGKTYLITGGTGGIGLAISQRIACDAKGVTLLLLGRRKLPEKKLWQAIAKSQGQANDPEYQTIRALVALEEEGINVQYRTVDLTDSTAIEAIVAEAEQNWGAVQGVIHAAGLADAGGIIQHRTIASSEDIFEAKVYGTIVLSTVFKNRKTDFFILCSSLASIVAPAAQVGYVAANAFLDAYAEQNVFGDNRMISLRWNAWLDVGMAARSSATRDHDFDSITPAQGYDILLRAIKRGRPTFIVSKYNLQEEFKLTEIVPEESLVQDTIARSADRSSEDGLHMIWTNFFGKKIIAAEDDFFEIGGDSLKALTMIGIIHKTLGVKLTISDFFNNSTIRKLAALMAQNMIGENNTVQYSPIPVGGKREFYPLSSAQKRLYILYELDKHSIAYNMPYVMSFEGELDDLRLNHAFHQLLARHDVLRTSFIIVDDEPVQRIEDAIDFSVEYFDAQETDTDGIVAKFIRPFDLSKANLIRIGVIRMIHGQYTIVLDMHHIISDGISFGILAREFVALYNNGVLPELKLQYKDFAAWQSEENKKIQTSPVKEFWVNEFATPVNPLNLPCDFDRPMIKSYDGETFNFNLSTEETSKLKALAENERTTLFTVVFAAYAMMLSKLSGQEDVVVGTGVSGRVHADVEPLIGMFVNTLSIRSFVSGELTTAEFLSAVKSKTLQCFDHQTYQYEDLVETLNLDRDLRRNPLFDVMFSYLKFDEIKDEIQGVKAVAYIGKNTPAMSKFDITLLVIEGAGQLGLSFEYCTKLFRRETIERFADYFKRIVTVITTEPTVRISDIDLTNDVERQLLVTGFNAGTFKYSGNGTLVSLLEEQCAKTPQNAALRLGDKVRTYEHLCIIVRRLAAYFQQEAGVRKGDTVGVMMNELEYVIPVVMGILKCGAAYVLLDSSDPVSRVTAIVQDSNMKVLVGGRPALKWLISADFIDEETLVQATESYSEEPSDVELDDAAVACITYESFPLNQPDGTRVTHREVLSQLSWIRKEYRIGQRDTVLIAKPLAVNYAQWELFWWMSSGASLCIPSANMLMADAIEENKVTCIHVTGHTLGDFLDILTGASAHNDLTSLRFVFSGGEFLRDDTVRTFGNILHNVYSTKLISVYHGGNAAIIAYREYTFDGAYSKSAVVKPAPDFQCYVLDKNRKLAPLGVQGELYVTREALKFTGNTAVVTNSLAGTGFVVRWLSEKELEICGKTNDSIEHKGMRIRASDVEAVLLDYKEIQKVLPVMRERNGKKIFTAFYEAVNDVDESPLHKFLSERLPEYMVPDCFIRLDKIPVNTQGAAILSALPSLEVATKRNRVGATNALEDTIIGLWAEAFGLNREDVSVDDNFFELGIQSLRATKLIFKIKREFNCDITLADIFQNPTIRGIGKFITTAKTSPYYSLEPTDPKEYYPVSSAQRRMYFLYRFDSTSIAYNLPQIFQLEGTVNVESLTSAFNGLIARHETLRTSFEEIDGAIIQKVKEHCAIQFEQFYAPDAAHIGSQIRLFVRPFDLASSPLVRAALLTVGNNECTILMVDMHHIVSDGVSSGILMRDFMALYTGAELGAPRLQFKDFAVWQQTELHQQKLTAQRNFWNEEYKQGTPALELPADFIRPSVKSYEGNAITVAIGVKDTRALKLLAQQEGSTLFMMLFSIYSIMLSKLGRTDDVVVGVPTAGRQHPDLKDIIGMFVNTLPVRLHPRADLSFRNYLSAVRSKMLACLDNQEFQYEDMIDMLGVVRDTSRNPLFDVMFTFEDFEEADGGLNELVFKPISSEHNVSKFDLTLVASDHGTQIILSIEYATRLFSKASIERFIGYFTEIAGSIVKDPEVKLADIKMLPAGEVERLVHCFNDSKVVYPHDKTVTDLFEEQVKRNPQQTAVIADGKTLTYEELNTLSNKLAHYLKKTYSIKPDDFIGVMMNRSENLIVAILAIIKAGGAYVPIDPAYPESRIALMIEKSELKALVTEPEYLQKVSWKNAFSLLDERDKINHEAASNPAKIVSANDLVYVIYTSGSTGVPKGVMVKHHSFTNLIQWYNRTLDMQAQDCVLLIAPLSFDLAQKNIFAPLVVGAALCLSEKLHLNYAAIANAIDELGVTIVNVAPSAFYPLLDVDCNGHYRKLRSLRKVILGGEPIHTKELIKWSNTPFYNASVINSYGPTECTDVVSYYEVANEALSSIERIPIGKPVDNTQLYILDANGALVPEGVTGEIFIGGVGVSRGYFRNDSLTIEKFVPNPLTEGDVVYKTGDLGRWLGSGDIDFLGRKDDQVKIRGYRIELAEIENHMIAHPLINEAVVTAKMNDGEKKLVAYFISAEAVDASDIRIFLSNRLPDHMIPSGYMRLEKMPLTPSGKIDKLALPEPLLLRKKHIAPTTDMEKMIVGVWQELLGVDSIGMDDNFFELGGNSLSIMRMISVLRKELNVDIPARVLMQLNTVMLLVQWIEINLPVTVVVPDDYEEVRL